MFHNDNKTGIEYILTKEQLKKAELEKKQIYKGIDVILIYTKNGERMYATR